MKANDLFWVLAVASVGVSAWAVYSMSEDAFYCAAGLMGAAFALYMYDNGVDQ